MSFHELAHRSGVRQQAQAVLIPERGGHGERKPSRL